MAIDRNAAIELWKKYNKSESLFHHALSVEAVMRKFAKEYGEDQDYWGIVGLLHDIDWEMFPEEHCKVAPRLLAEIDAPEDVIHAIQSHGYGVCIDVKPERKMEIVLYTIDELTGLITATALMRPEKMQGISVKSVKKKWSSKGFAAGVNRDIISNGAEMLGEELPKIIQIAIDAMTEIAKDINLWPEA